MLEHIETASHFTRILFWKNFFFKLYHFRKNTENLLKQK